MTPVPFSLCAYGLMPNHYHLLTPTAYRGTISAMFGRPAASPFAGLRQGLVLGGAALWDKAVRLLEDSKGRDELRWRRRRGGRRSCPGRSAGRIVSRTVAFSCGFDRGWPGQVRRSWPRVMATRTPAACTARRSAWSNERRKTRPWLAHWRNIDGVCQLSRVDPESAPPAPIPRSHLPAPI